MKTQGEIDGTVKPSDIPITMSRTVSEAVKCFSTCGVCGTGLVLVSVRVLDHSTPQRSTFGLSVVPL